MKLYLPFLSSSTLLPSSILHPPSSILHPPSSILHPPSSHPPSSILLLILPLSISFYLFFPYSFIGPFPFRHSSASRYPLSLLSGTYWIDWRGDNYNK